MNLDVLALIVTALAGLVAALVSWRTVHRTREAEVVLRSNNIEFSLPSSKDLQPTSVERRLRALWQVAPDAAAVDAWSTLETLVNRKRRDDEPLHGRRLRDYLVHENYVTGADTGVLDSLLQARNTALHVSEEAPILPLETYLPLVLRIATESNQRTQ